MKITKDLINFSGTEVVNLPDTDGAYRGAYVHIMVTQPPKGDVNKTLNLQVLTYPFVPSGPNILSNDQLSLVKPDPSIADDNPLHTVIISPGIQNYTSPQNSTTGWPKAVITIPVLLPQKMALRFIPSDASDLWSVKISIQYVQ